MKRIVPLLLIALILTIPIIAQEFEDEEEDERFEDLGEAMGSAAIGLLVLGSAYIGMRRLYSWSRSWSDDKEHYKKVVMDGYRTLRKPLLIFHNIVMVLATIAAAIHGLAFSYEDGFVIVSGIIAWIVMVLLSVFGFIIYYRLRPIWDNRKAKGFIRFFHRQWILSVVLIVFLVLHLINA